MRNFHQVNRSFGIRSFTRHGKGEVDGAGALLQKELCKEQIKPQGFKIQNAKKVVNLLQFKANKFHAAHPNARKI
jgi:hypothetical protein